MTTKRLERSGKKLGPGIGGALAYTTVNSDGAVSFAENRVPNCSTVKNAPLPVNHDLRTILDGEDLTT